MKIKYEFVDGTVSEIEVNEKIGNLIKESRRQEENAERRERYHCPVSLDSFAFEGRYFLGGTKSPEQNYIEREKQQQIDMFLSRLSDVQKKRLKALLDGKSIRQIAREENVHHKSVEQSVIGLQIKYKNFFENTPPKQ